MDDDEELMRHLETCHPDAVKMRFLIEPGRTARRFAAGRRIWEIYHEGLDCESRAVGGEVPLRSAGGGDRKVGGSRAGTGGGEVPRARDIVGVRGRAASGRGGVRVRREDRDIPAVTCRPEGSMAPPGSGEMSLCGGCDQIIMAVPAQGRNDWTQKDLQGREYVDLRPPGLRSDPKKWWADLARDHIGTYSVLSASIQTGQHSWYHVHRPGKAVRLRPSYPDPPKCCGRWMWSSPGGWVCRVAGWAGPKTRVYPYEGSSMETGPDAEVLGMTLQVAVPLRIGELQAFRRGGGDLDQRCEEWAKETASKIAHEGDALMYPSKKGKTADVFNALAKGIAAGAFMPGGLNAFGLIWCAIHSSGGRHNGGYLGPCLLCTNDEEIDKMQKTSLTTELWTMLDRVMARLMNSDATEADGGPREDGRDPGRAETFAYVLSLLINPYNPDMDAVRAEAMERWNNAQAE